MARAPHYTYRVTEKMKYWSRDSACPTCINKGEIFPDVSDHFGSKQSIVKFIRRLKDAESIHSIADVRCKWRGPVMSGSTEFSLYGYFRSSAAFRTRIAFNLKGVKPDLRFIHLLRDGGEQHSERYKALNPQQLIPALVHQGQTITQSLAIIEYLDEIVPMPSLLPSDPVGRARVRQLALAVACDIHPINNLRVMQYLKHVLGADEQVRTDWQCHWITAGLLALETVLQGDAATGLFCHGDTPTLADAFLIPQLANARRARMDLSNFPTLLRIEEAAYQIPAFVEARPDNQPDAE